VFCFQRKPFKYMEMLLVVRITAADLFGIGEACCTMKIAYLAPAIYLLSRI
jgi:hypothetical protein